MMPQFCGRLIIIFMLLVSTTGEMFNIQKQTHQDFILRWKDREGKILYEGESIKEMVDTCPDGCSGDCANFPTKIAEKTETAPCTPADIEALREAQSIGKGWLHLIDNVKMRCLIHWCQLGVILILIIILIVKGHYKLKDLLYVPSKRQWQVEQDPTWGLPGKVWGLLEIRAVKSKNKEPTDRKLSYYTESPTVMGDKFWSYKHAMRVMYKTHQYYKRDRYFHKLAWQILKLKMVIPETLRRHKNFKRRAAELEDESVKQAPDEFDPQSRLPWTIDLLNEVNLKHLEDVKKSLEEQVAKLTEEGTIVNGRFFLSRNRHHHHAVAVEEEKPKPLTKDEVEARAKAIEKDPNASYVNVEGIMKIDPVVKYNVNLKRLHHHKRRQHRHHHRQQQQRHQLKRRSTPPPLG